ncbi:P-loop containing nucleoside triphosphate hydrolase protein [Chytriomyces cf. hyalinus JEL632]|nr:P-loop containing nucleoside triphosphate hydrolase protein [Chytriomyces cf. hyalinus JEL632]
MSTILIGCAGASCSGKSTLTEWLSKILGLPVIHQDRFFKADSDVPVVNGIMHWDCPGALDMSEFAAFLKNVRADPAFVDSELSPNRPTISDKDISSHELDHLMIRGESFRSNHSANNARASSSGTRIFLVDGFLMMSDPDVMAQLDYVLFLHSDYQILKERREARFSYVTLEGTWQDPPGYFDDIVYPAYVEYNARVLDPLKQNEGSGVKSNVRKVELDLASRSLSVFCIDSGKVGISEMVRLCMDIVQEWEAAPASVVKTGH